MAAEETRPATTVDVPAAGGRQAFESVYGPVPGTIVETSCGTTHYILETPTENAKGTTVVLVHGLGASCLTWNRVAAELLAAGYSVFRHDLYDRGYSQTDPARFTVNEYDVSHTFEFTLEQQATQLDEVLEAAGLGSTPVILVGHSTGGGIVMARAGNHPQATLGLVLMATICFPPTKPWIAYLTEVPLLGPFLVRNFGKSTFVKFARNGSVDEAVMEEYFAKLERHVEINPRYMAAVRNTNANCRGFIEPGLEEEFRLVCNNGTPIQLIWGERDASVPIDHCNQLEAIAKELGAPLLKTTFADMPHGLFYDDAKPVECAKTIADFSDGLRAGS